MRGEPGGGLQQLQRGGGSGFGARGLGVSSGPRSGTGPGRTGQALNRGMGRGGDGPQRVGRARFFLTSPPSLGVGA